MKKYIIFMAILLLFATLTSSCNSIFFAVYGMSDKVEQLDRQEIIKFVEKFNIEISNLYEMDSTYYDFLGELDKDTANYEITHHHYQPFQAMYFDKDGNLTSYFIGCYAKMGFPNFIWSPNKEFDTFPPAQQKGLSLDTLFNYFQINRFFNKFSENDSISEQQYDYYVVVIWTTFGGRQSKRLIKTVQKNAKLATVNVKYLFVNYDNFYVYECKKSLK